MNEDVRNLLEEAATASPQTLTLQQRSSIQRRVGRRKRVRILGSAAAVAVLAGAGMAVLREVPNQGQSRLTVAAPDACDPSATPQDDPDRKLDTSGEFSQRNNTDKRPSMTSDEAVASAKQLFLSPQYEDSGAVPATVTEISYQSALDQYGLPPLRAVSPKRCMWAVDIAARPTPETNSAGAAFVSFVVIFDKQSGQLLGQKSRTT